MTAPHPSQVATTASWSTSAPRHLTWPATRCYFALLDASGIPSSERVTEERLRFFLEPDLPEPLDEVHAVFHPLGGRRWLACAVRRDLLEREVPESAVTLVPDSVPEALRAAIGEAVEPAALQLLVGPYEARAVRSARLRVLGVVAAALLLTLGAVLYGLEQRIALRDARVEKLRLNRASRVEDALGPPPPGQALPPELRLLAELRALRQTRRQGDALAAPFDATDALAQLLSAWPESLATRTDSLIVTEAAVHARGTVGASDDAQALADATGSLAGYQASFPGVQSAPEGWRFALEWRSSGDAARPGGRR